MNPIFKIKIDDGYCEWKFKIEFSSGDISIEKIVNTISRNFESQVINKQLTKKYQKKQNAK